MRCVCTYLLVQWGLQVQGPVGHQEAAGRLHHGLRTRLLWSVLNLPYYQSHRIPTQKQVISLMGFEAAPAEGSPTGLISPLVNLFFYRLGTESSDLEVDTASLQGDDRLVSLALISGNLLGRPSETWPSRNPGFDVILMLWTQFSPSTVQRNRKAWTGIKPVAYLPCSSF